MKWGTFKAGQAKFATSALQVSTIEHLTAYDFANAGNETLAIGQLVTGKSGDWINGYVGAQQTDAISYDHPAGEIIAPYRAASLTQAIAMFGTDCAYVASGQSLMQMVAASDVPDYRRWIASAYVRRLAAGSGSIAIQWGVDALALTVTAAGANWIADASQSMTEDEHVDKTIYVFGGSGGYQTRTVSANTTTQLIFTSSFKTVPSVGDTCYLVDFASPAVRTINSLTGTTRNSGAVMGYAPWQRYFVTFRPETTDFTYLFVRFAATGNLYVDGAKLEEAPKLYTGISTGATSSRLTDTNAFWTEDALIGCDVILLDGNDAGDCQAITDNAQQYVDATFDTTPSTATIYIIVPGETATLPTPYDDDSGVNRVFQSITANWITSGTLRIGGGLAARPSIAVEDYDGTLLARIGGNYNATMSRGIQLLNRASLYMAGGAILMNPNRTAADYGSRIRMDHTGIEVYKRIAESDILKFWLYPEAGVGWIMGTSPLQERIELNDTLGIAAITHEGNTFFAVNPVTQTAWLGAEKYIKYDTVNGTQVNGNVMINGTVTAKAFNLSEHGVASTFSSNTPATGSVAWSDVNVVFMGRVYPITDGETTKKIIWWDYTYPTVFQTTDSAPAGFDGFYDLVIGYNNAGAFVRCWQASGIYGSIIVANSITVDKLYVDSLLQMHSGAEFVWGTGTRDDNLTGFSIYQDGTTGVFVAQNAGTDQFKIGTDGKAYWADTGQLSASGALIECKSTEDTQQWTWWYTDEAGTNVAKFYGIYDSGIISLHNHVRQYNTATNAYIETEVGNLTDDDLVKLQMQTRGSVIASAAPEAWFKLYTTAAKPTYHAFLERMMVLDSSADDGGALALRLKSQGSSAVHYWEGSTPKYYHGYDAGNNRWVLYSEGQTADVIRIPDGQLTVDGNATFDDNAFDYVCRACGWHSEAGVDKCPICGHTVEWQDDAALMSAVVRSPGKVKDLPRHLLTHLEKLGIANTYGTLASDNPEVFLSLTKSHWFTWSAVAQLWNRIRKLEERLGE